MKASDALVSGWRSPVLQVQAAVSDGRLKQAELTLAS